MEFVFRIDSVITAEIPEAVASELPNLTGGFPKETSSYVSITADNVIEAQVKFATEHPDRNGTMFISAGDLVTFFRNTKQRDVVTMTDGGIVHHNVPSPDEMVDK